MPLSNAIKAVPGSIEVRSIDYVPDEERHGSTAKVAGLLYFSIAFGKVTVTSLNAYGSFMSIATMVSGVRRGLRISVQHRFVYIVAMVGASALLALSGRHSFLQ